MVIWLWLWLWPEMLTGCAQPTGLDALRACADLGCQRAAIVSAANLDHSGTVAWLTQQADPLTQVALVTTLGSQDPGLLHGICPQLDTAAAQRCDRFVERPHLGQAPKPRPGAQARPGGGPAGTALRVPPQPKLVGDPAARAAVSERCGPDAACVTQAARDGGAAQQPALAEAACLILQGDPAAAGECRFQAAESAVATAGVDGLTVALSLCAASIYASDCLVHSLALTLPPTTFPDHVDPAAVSAMRDVAGRIDRIVGGADPRSQGSQAAAVDAVDLAWNLWICSAFGVGAPGQAPTPTGDLLDVVPAAAARHVRFGVASLVALERPGDTIDALVIASRQALGRRSPQPAPEGIQGSNRRPVVVPRIADRFWPGDLPGEEHLPATWARGNTRRMTDPDPDVDLSLAVVAALALNPGRPPTAPLLAVLRDPDRAEPLRLSAVLAVAARDPQFLSAWVSQHATEVRAAPPLVAARLTTPPEAPATGSHRTRRLHRGGRR